MGRGHELCLSQDRLQDGGRGSRTHEIILLSSVCLRGRPCEGSVMFVRPCSCSFVLAKPRGGGHGPGVGLFLCKSQVSRKHPLDPTGLWHVAPRELGNLTLTSKIDAMFRPHSWVVIGGAGLH